MTFNACILCSLLGACPRLERIEVHIGISDYFMNVDDDISKRKYKRIVKKLMVSKNILHNSLIDRHPNRVHNNFRDIVHAAPRINSATANVISRQNPL